MSNLSVQHHKFDNDIFQKLSTNHFAKDLWPIVYIISDNESQTAYIGETTDAFSRLSAHLRNSSKNKLTSIHLIGSSFFNKSATLDIEANLIKYMSADGVYQLINGNLGLANHNYYQKGDVYWKIFKSVWDRLRMEGLTKHSLEHIDNSDLFKYSPYKSLHADQITALIVMLESILSSGTKVTIMEGGAGTGKTILASYFFKLLSTENLADGYAEFGEQEQTIIELVKAVKRKYPILKMALVVPMSSFRGTMKNVFRNIKGLTASMVIGPAQVTREKYDILVVDESHRLRQKRSIGAYIGAFNKAALRMGLDPDHTHELEWVVTQSDNSILFYDENQSIKPSDVDTSAFQELKNSSLCTSRTLKSQLRVLGGTDYVDFVDQLLQCQISTPKSFNSKVYELVHFKKIEELVSEIKLRNNEHGLSRVVAGFSWEWISNKEGKEHLKDIQIGTTQLKWNSVTEDWINSAHAIDEVGCIHTTQGYDLNYVGIIFGNEITYDSESNSIVILKENYKDKTGRQTNSAEELQSYVLNIYKTMMLRGIKGTYVYACDSDLRKYFSQFLPSLETESEAPLLFEEHTIKPYENAIPVYSLDVAAGSFGDRQVAEQAAWIIPPKSVRITRDHFACKIVGESMNRVIPNGSYAVFRKYRGGTREGKIVLVEHSDIQDLELGSCYTVKEYASQKSITLEGWQHESITLKPLSNSDDYDEINLTDDPSSQLQVIGIFECIVQ